MKLAPIVLLIMTGFLRAQPATQPTTQDVRVWQLTSYLKGTTPQIHQSLWAETVRLQGKVDEATRAIEDDKKSIEDHKAAIASQLLENKDYQQAQEKAAAIKSQLDAARAAKNSSEAMRLSSVYNNARDVAARIERDAYKNSEGSKLVKGDQARLADDEKKLELYKKGLADAEKWRNDVVDAVRNSARIHWPLKVGDVGILGEIESAQFRDNGDVVGKVKVHEIGEQLGQENEGLRQVKVITREATVTVKNSGLNAGKAGETIRFDRSVKIVKADPDENGEPLLLTVEVSAGDDLDQLMKAMTTP